MKSLYLADSVTGAGKTHSATDIAAEKSGLGINHAIVMPTKKLIRQAIAKLKDRLKRGNHPDIADRIKMIVSDANIDEKVSSRIHEFLKTVGKNDGRILFITHEAFQRVRHWHNREHWHIIVDEVMEAVYSETFALKRHRHILLDLIQTEPHDEKYSRVVALDQAKIEEWVTNNDDDMVVALFSSLASRVNPLSNWSVFVETEQFTQFTRGEKCQLAVHGRLSPAIFDRFASVTLMAANLKQSLMFKIFENDGCTFQPHNGIMNRLRYRQHNNGSRLTVLYLTERVWSKNLRRLTVTVNGEPLTLLELLQQQVERQFGDRKYLWIANKDIDDDTFSGTRLPNIPHGLDQYQEYNQCLIVSALNASPAHRKFLASQAGIDERQFRRSVLSQVAYQALGRGGLRRPDGTEPFTMIVLDRDTADDLLALYPGATMAPLMAYDPVPAAKPPGSPKVHATPTDRVAAYRARQKAQDELNDVCNALLYNRSEALQDQADLIQGGFCFTPFRSHRDPVGGPAIHSMTLAEFYGLLCRLAQNRFDGKKANRLFAPTLFSHGRKNADALAHLGLILDFDHSRIPLDKIASLLPDLSYIVYTTASHTPEDWKYRLCIPTTAYMTPENAMLLREMLIGRFSQAGYTAAEHGIDRSKIGPSALFYWPMHMPHSVVHLIDGPGRTALDPAQWLQDAPLPEQLPCPPPMLPDSPFLKERRKAGAIRAFLTRGTIKGNGHRCLFGLGMTLGVVGCDAAEIHQTLSEMAAMTTNPSERRSEISGIVQAATRQWPAVHIPSSEAA